MIDRNMEIVVLSALVLLGDDKSAIPFESIRHVRVILSLFNEEILSEEEYSQIINTLADKGYIKKIDDRIEITHTGKALVRSIGRKIIGQTYFERLSKLIDDYVQEGTDEYMKKIGRKLKSLQEAKGKKVDAVDKSLIRAIGLVLKINHKYSELFLQTFELPHEIMRDEEVLDREIGRFKNKFLKSKGYPIIIHRENNTLQVITFTKVDKITLFNKELKFSKRKTINREDIVGWNRIIASAIMEGWVRKLGYIRSRRSGHNYINYRHFEISTTSAGKLREYGAMNLDFIELKEDQVFVWVETYTSPIKSVLDFINEKFENETNKRNLLDVLNPFKIRIIPSGTEIQIRNILLNRDLSKEKVPKTNQTFEDYWRAKYDIEFSQKIQPIFIIEGWDGELHYPAEALYIDRYSLEKDIDRICGRKPRYEDPPKRAKKIEYLFNQLKKVRDDYLKEYVCVDLQKCNPTVEELSELGGLMDAVYISPPLLEFYRNAVSLDPLDVFNPSYGMVSGKRNIFVTHLITPYNTPEKDIEHFIGSLQIMFSRYGLGKIEMDEGLRIIKYDTRDLQALENKIRKLGEVTYDRNIGIAILPDDGEAYYYSLKKIFSSRTKVPLLDIKYSTFQQIISGDFRGSKYLSLKILIKSLKEGEAIWTLANTAGLLKERTLYIGIGFSRYPREGKVSKCAAVLHDSYGNRISWKVFSTIQERTITKQWFDTLLLRIREIVEKENPTRLLFYRTGTVYPTELSAIETSIESCNWLSQIKISFVSILDGRNYRFSLYEGKYKNLPTGYGIIINNKEAFLSTSNYDERDLKQGTVIPIRLKLEFGDDNIIDILKEYHDLTYLNWLAPETTSKYPLVVRIAERFAELTREGVPSESIFYLDL